MKTMLVTGASGALGRTVVARLNRSQGYKVVSAGRQVVSDTAVHIHCDVCEREHLSAVFDQIQPDVVLHLAASFSGSLDEAYATNVAPSQNILDYIQNMRLKTRVVLIGSAAEYGAVEIDDNPIRENRVLAPISVYGVSKAWQTQLVGLYASRGADVICARIFNLYGPGVSARLFVGRLRNEIAEVLAGRKSTIEIGPLTAIRDYISTEEAAIQLLTIAAHGESGEIYHIASSVPVTMREFLMRQLQEYGLDPAIVREAKSFSNRSGYDVPVIYGDITKTVKLSERGKTNGKAQTDGCHPCVQ